MKSLINFLSKYIASFKKNRKGKKVMSKTKVALNIGHYPPENDYGASNKKYGVTEWEFNSGLVKKIKGSIPSDEVELYIVNDSYHNLDEHINKLGVDYCIAFHCNAFDGKTEGHEVLHYTTSKDGNELAHKFNDAIGKVLGNTDRGVKGIDIDDRGGALVKRTTMPCIILEPFFIDNDEEYVNALDKEEELVDEYINQIRNL